MTAAHPTPDAAPHPRILPAPPAPPPPLDSGWTPDRQVRFLEAIAEGHLVRDACRAVGLTPTSAYSFRRRANGAAFALGWAAANLHARERLADTLLERAVDGQTETVTRADGEVIQRHRHDNRLGLAMLARLDRLAAADRPAASGLPRTADAADAPHPAADPAHAARTVAAGFESYLDLIGQDVGPARARLFVDLAAQDAAGGALALADRRLHAADPLPDPLPDPAPPADDTPADPDADADPAADAPDPTLVQLTTMTTTPPAPRDHAVLYPADRAGWTATDWARAEAAGLFRFTTSTAAPAVAPATGPAMPPGPPPIDPARIAELMQTEKGRTVLLADALARYGHSDTPTPAAPEPPKAVAAADADANDDSAPVWRDGENGWRTSFPPPDGFDGWHEFDHGDPEYSRALTWEEEAIAERFEAAEPARLAAVAARDAWFAGGGAPAPDPAPDPEPPVPDAAPSTLSDATIPPPALRNAAQDAIWASSDGLSPDSDPSHAMKSLGEDIAHWSRSVDDLIHRSRTARQGTPNPVADP